MTDALSAAIESILRTDDLSEEIHQAQINNLRGAYEAALAQPAQDTDCHLQGICQRSGYNIGQRKPLSEEEIERITDEHWPDFVAFTRVVEAAHGIGGES